MPDQGGVLSTHKALLPLYQIAARHQGNAEETRDCFQVLKAKLLEGLEPTGAIKLDLGKPFPATGQASITLTLHGVPAANGLRIRTLTYERCPHRHAGMNMATMPRLSVVPDVHPPLPVEVRDAELRRITHDLGNLLVMIVGSSYALRVGLPNSSARRDAADIESAGQRAGVLVERLAASLADGPPALPEEWEAD